MTVQWCTAICHENPSPKIVPVYYYYATKHWCCPNSKLTVPVYGFPWQDFFQTICWLLVNFLTFLNSCQIPRHFQVFQTYGQPKRKTWQKLHKRKEWTFALHCTQETPALAQRLPLWDSKASSMLGRNFKINKLDGTQWRTYRCQGED